MNVALLKKIKKHILKVPERYTFNWAGSTTAAPCGTKACIAGWAMVLSGKLTAEEVRNFGSSGWNSEDAAKILKLDREQASKLFIWWPEEFHNHDYFDAKVAANRIDHFIKTKGRE